MAAFWSDVRLHIGLLQPGVFLVQRTSYVFWVLERNCFHWLSMCLALGEQMGISREVGHGIVKDGFGLWRLGNIRFQQLLRSLYNLCP